jgi:hypothetical protein
MTFLPSPMVSRNFLGSKSRVFVPGLVCDPKGFSELLIYTPLNFLKIYSRWRG